MDMPYVMPYRPRTSFWPGPAPYGAISHSTRSARAPRHTATLYRFSPYLLLRALARAPGLRSTFPSPRAVLRLHFHLSQPQGPYIIRRKWVPYLRPNGPQGDARRWALGDRVSLETAVPPALGKGITVAHHMGENGRLWRCLDVVTAPPFETPFFCCCGGYQRRLEQTDGQVVWPRGVRSALVFWHVRGA